MFRIKRRFPDEIGGVEKAKKVYRRVDTFFLSVYITRYLTI